MCGIAGIVAPPALSPEHAHRALAAMRAAQRHRGPDDEGDYWTESARVGLTNCRLSVRDLSAAGHMPMCADDVCITYNGEIYNAGEVRSLLEQRGRTFLSHSDTEVILQGYLEWGIEVLGRLRGMFAFAVFDPRTDVLLLARDPLGIKPLYYSTAAPFTFASELRAVTASGIVGMELDDQALSAYLQLGSIPAPLTIYRDVRALLPGHYMTVQAGAGNPAQPQRYWDFPAHNAAIGADDVRTALEDAVRSHLVSDVPVGAFLSGGLDSSTIVTLAAGMRAEPLRTCSIAFESRDHDESEYARAVARALGTEHYERLVTRRDFSANIDALTNALDQPSIDGFNTFFVAQTAHQQGLKVALSGLGGDELFGGYPSFTGVPRLMRAMKAAQPVAAAMSAIGRSDRWQKVAEAARRPARPAAAFLAFRGLFTEREAARLTRAARFDTMQHVETNAGADASGIQDWTARAELRTYTAPQLLRDSDVMSMAHSLELRVPLLDTRLVETVFAMSPDTRFRGSGNKPLLRRLMAKQLPEIVTQKRNRQGFTFPLQQWLGEPESAELWNWDAPIFGRFDRAALHEVRKRFTSGHAHWSRAWCLMALNEWSRRNAHA